MIMATSAGRRPAGHDRLRCGRLLRVTRRPAAGSRSARQPAARPVSSAALEFLDPDDADQHTLHSAAVVAQRPRRAAYTTGTARCLPTTCGADAAPCEPSPAPLGTTFDASRVDGRRGRTISKGEFVGTLLLRQDLATVERRARRQALVALGLLLPRRCRRDGALGAAAGARVGAAPGARRAPHRKCRRAATIRSAPSGSPKTSSARWSTRSTACSSGSRCARASCRKPTTSCAARSASAAAPSRSAPNCSSASAKPTA